MDKMKEAEKEYVSNLTEDERAEYYAMPEERRKHCITEKILSRQDEEMWDKNEGISQLEHRINTESFQG